MTDESGRSPRRGAVVLGALFLLLSLCTVPSAWVLLSLGYGHPVLELMKLNAPWGILISVAHSAVAVLLGIFGLLFLLGKRVPGAVLLLPTLVPPVLAFGASALSFRHVTEAAASPGLTASEGALIIAVGSAESAIPGALGLAAFATLALAIVVLMAFDGMSVDARKAAPTAPLGRGVQFASAVVAIVALGFSVILRLLLGATIGAMDILSWLGFAAGFLATVWVASGLYKAQGLYPETRGALWRHAGLGALALAAAVGASAVLAMHAIPAGALLKNLPGISAADKLAVLAAASQKVHYRGVFGLVDAALALLTFSVPLVAVHTARREGTRQLGAGVAANVVWALGAAGLLFGSVLGIRWYLGSQTAQWDRLSSTPGVELPRSDDADLPPPVGAALFVSREGKLLVDEGTGGGVKPWSADPFPALRERAIADEVGQMSFPIALAADQQLRFADLARALEEPKKAGYLRFELVAGPLQPRARPDLGPWSRASGTDLATVPFRIGWPGMPTGNLAPFTGAIPIEQSEAKRGGSKPDVRSAPLDIILVEEGQAGRFYTAKQPGGWYRLDLGAAPDAEQKRTELLRKLADGTPDDVRLMLAPRADSTVAELTTLLGILQKSLRAGSPATDRLSLYVMLDRTAAESGIRELSEVDPNAPVAPPVAPPPTGAGTPIRGNVSVSTPESTAAIANLARVVAGMRAGIRRCYTRELEGSPTAKGKLEVTAKIGPNGEVTVADVKEKDGAPAATAACVQARVQAAIFDPPEGGSAKVTFTVVLVPGD